MQRLICFIIFILIGYGLHAQPLEWKFDDRYKDELLFLHSFVNYDYHSEWYFSWEENQIRKNQSLMSFGSVEINDLLCDYHTVVNASLSTSWWFRLDHRYYASQHLDNEIKYLFMGFERAIYGNLSAFLQINPAFDKEEIDGLFGFGFSNNKQDKYIRLAVLYEDFVYDSKNDLGGVTTRLPRGIDWQLRWGSRDFWIYSQGRMSTGFIRDYRDQNKSTELKYHSQRINRGNLKFYYWFLGRDLAELSFSYYGFRDKKKFIDDNNNYYYENDIFLTALKYAVKLTRRQQLRLISRYVNKKSIAGGLKNYTYSRWEFLPAVFYEYKLGKTAWEFGYKGAIQEWDYEDIEPLLNYRQDSYADKLKFGFKYTFNKDAKLQLSISHVLRYWGFGGGNLQFITTF